MVCPNCRSNEVIAVQGENFCINCGQLVPKAAAPVVSTDGLPDGVVLMPVGAGAALPITSSKPRRTKLGRPKAGKLDVPAAATDRITSRPAVDLVAAPVADKPPVVMHDIVRPHLPPPKPRALPAVVQTAAIAYGHILSGSLGGRFTHRRFMMAVVPAALLGIIATISGLVLASAHPNELVSATVATGWPVYGELVITGLLYYLVRSLSHAAIIFGSARLDDHRPLATNRWLEVAADSQGRRLGLDIVAALSLVAVSGIAATLFVVGGSSDLLPPAAQAGLLAIAYSALAYLALSIIMTVSLGHVAVTLTNVRTSSGLKLGWRLFRHHFELAGARLTALAVELIGAVIIAVGAGGWYIVTPAGLRPAVIVALGLVFVVVAALAGSGAAIWWQSVYRELVSADHPAGFHRLLSTSTPKVARRGPIVIVVSSILTLAALAAIWPWIMR